MSPSSSQPTTDLAAFTVRVANQAQQEQHARACYAIWNKGATWGEYWGIIQREKKEAAWGKDHAFLTWALVKAGDPEGQLFSGCETYRRRGWVKRKGSNEVEEGTVYALASVVTPQDHLRKGYATRMLSLLHHHLGPLNTLPPIPKSWGGPQQADYIPPFPSSMLPKAVGSILWTDVGSNFYARCSIGTTRPGWVVDDSSSSEVVWKILPPEGTIDSSVEWLYQEDMPSVTDELSARLKAQLQRADTSEHSLFAHDPASPGALTFIQTLGDWNNPPIRDNIPLGLRIRLPSGNTQDDTIVLFALNNKAIGSRLLVTYVSNLKPVQLPVVLRAFDELAVEAGHSLGWAWGLDPESELVDTWKKLPGREARSGRRQEIDGLLLAVAWYGEEKEDGRLFDGQMWGWS
ncbi:hypothetical protein IAT38_004684 [Cryptococcus sp. DSM 104549]